MNAEDLIKKIERHADEFGLSKGYICRSAVNSSQAYARIVAGKDILLRVANEIVAWIDEDAVRRREKAKAKKHGRTPKS